MIKYCCVGLGLINNYTYTISHRRGSDERQQKQFKTLGCGEAGAVRASGRVRVLSARLEGLFKRTEALCAVFVVVLLAQILDIVATTH